MIPGKVVKISIGALLAGALVQGAVLVLRGWSAAAVEAPSTGVPVDIALRDVNGRSVDLASLYPGLCKYAILASTSCPYCDNLQVRWTVRGLHNGVEVPEGWAVFWILNEQEPSGFFDQQFPVPYFVSQRYDELFARAGVNGTPAHMILDRDGSFVSSGMQTPLPTSSTLGKDCRLANTEVL